MENKKIGRPKKTLNDLPNGWQIKLREMGQEGMLDIDAIVYLGIARDTFYKLMEEHPEFLEWNNKMKTLFEQNIKLYGLESYVKRMKFMFSRLQFPLMKSFLIIGKIYFIGNDMNKAVENYFNSVMNLDATSTEYKEILILLHGALNEAFQITANNLIQAHNIKLMAMTSKY